MTTEEQRKIVRELGRLYPETKCFLDHGKDYELLFAVILSAQATDVSVNKATKSLFKAFPTLESFAKATPETIEPYIKSVGLSKTKSRHLVDAAKKLLSEHAGELPKDCLFRGSGSRPPASSWRSFTTFPISLSTPMSIA